MPFITAKLSVALEANKEDIAVALAKIASDDLGKPEHVVMVNIEEKQYMRFQGTSEPCAYVEVKTFKASDPEALKRMTAHICSTLVKLCSIPAERTFVSYYPTDAWGWNGSNF